MNQKKKTWFTIFREVMPHAGVPVLLLWLLLVVSLCFASGTYSRIMTPSLLDTIFIAMAVGGTVFLILLDAGLAYETYASQYRRQKTMTESLKDALLNISEIASRALEEDE